MVAALCNGSIVWQLCKSWRHRRNLVVKRLDEDTSEIKLLVADHIFGMSIRVDVIQPVNTLHQFA